MNEAKGVFLDAYYGCIKRPGAEAMLLWLEKNGFFEAPASTKYHLAYPGGLVEHSANVYYRLLDITERDLLSKSDALWLPDEVMETVAILGLLHDVCKVGVYHQAKGGGYEFRDPLPLGHGEKSLYIISRHMELREEEALAIRWHMGAYDVSRMGARSLDTAMAISPWVWRLQEADMCAVQIDEKGDKPT